MFLRYSAACREEAYVQLKFLYHPVSDIEVAATFFHDQLGFEEAWRDGSLTVAFRIPDGSAQVMCSLTDQPPGPMYLVDDLDDWINAHPDVKVSVAKAGIPGGSVAGFSSPGGNTFYVFDQPNA
jgi:catechol 2,3-dioxygenase-like lactoylglutathione lyase family enzyme